MEAEEELVAHSAQANEIKYQVVTTEGLEVGAMASEQVTQLIGTQDVQIESGGETESEEDVEQVLDVESGKTKGQEGSAREVVYRY